MPKINQEEYEVLKGLDDKWKWIARDTSRNRHRSKLSKYKEKPKKTPYQWLAFNYEDMDDSKFKFIKWSDEEPYNIAELIKEYEFGKILLAMAKEEIVLELECESEEIE